MVPLPSIGETWAIEVIVSLVGCDGFSCIWMFGFDPGAGGPGLSFLGDRNTATHHARLRERDK